MKEKDLIKLGFSRVDVSEEESGAAPFHYYTWNHRSTENGLCLISNASDDYLGKRGRWYAEIFDRCDIRFCEKKDLKQFIKLVNKNTIK